MPELLVFRSVQSAIELFEVACVYMCFIIHTTLFYSPISLLKVSCSSLSVNKVVQKWLSHSVIHRLSAHRLSDPEKSCVLTQPIHYHSTRQWSLPSNMKICTLHYTNIWKLLKADIAWEHCSEFIFSEEQRYQLHTIS